MWCHPSSNLNHVFCVRRYKTMTLSQQLGRRLRAFWRWLTDWEWPDPYARSTLYFAITPALFLAFAAISTLGPIIGSLLAPKPPKPPELPKPPEPPKIAEANSLESAGRTAADLERRRRQSAARLGGRQSTILTSPLGLNDNNPSRIGSLLG